MDTVASIFCHTLHCTCSTLVYKARELYKLYTRLTSKDVVLVILVGLRTHFDETLEAVVADKLVHQILVILKTQQHTHSITTQNLVLIN